MIIARKIESTEEIPQADLVDKQNRCFVPAAQKIFEEWWNVYSDGNGKFTPETGVRFIKGCTHEDQPKDDSRIVGLLNMFNREQEGFLTKEHFMDFFLNASFDKPERVFENLSAHHIRNDLQWIHRIKEENEFTKEQMPRYTLSENQEHFDLLMNILEKNKDAQ